jgi:hypothetical protein
MISLSLLNQKVIVFNTEADDNKTQTTMAWSVSFRWLYMFDNGGQDIP